MKTENLKYLIFIFFLYCSCGHESGNDGYSGDSGKGGSLARFTISGNYLYTVDERTLRVFDISTPSTPIKSKEVNPGFGVETIFSIGSRLYLGTMSGMYIYDISTPQNPQQKSFFSHIRSCDPVVANDTCAFVTLSTGSGCWSGTNELQVINITNASNPYLVKTYTMNSPRGLGIDGNLLFVCDQGLKVYDASNVMNLQLKHSFSIDAVDVIALSGLLLVVGNSGIYEYAYANNTVSLLSTLRTF